MICDVRERYQAKEQNEAQQKNKQSHNGGDAFDFSFFVLQLLVVSGDKPATKSRENPQREQKRVVSVAC